jgi:uncharacterized protein involved in outer membrane biogenesis
LLNFRININNGTIGDRLLKRIIRQLKRAISAKERAFARTIVINVEDEFKKF